MPGWALGAGLPAACCQREPNHWWHRESLTHSAIVSPAVNAEGTPVEGNAYAFQAFEIYLGK